MRWGEVEGCVVALFRVALPLRWDEADGRIAAILEVTAAGGLAVAGSFRYINWRRSPVTKDLPLIFEMVIIVLVDFYRHCTVLRQISRSLGSVLAV